MKKLRCLVVSTALVLTVALAGVFSDVSARPLNATAPNMGAAGSFSVLGATTVTNTGATSLSGDIGVWAGTAITGLDQITLGGEAHPGDAVAKRAQVAAGDAVNDISGQANTGGTLGALDGLTLNPGVYDMGAGSLGGGILTLSGAGVYLFRTSSSLVSAGSVVLADGARACDVFWFVASDATLNGSSFVGTVIAHSSIWFGTGAKLDGRAIAQIGEVTLNNNIIDGPSCQGPVVPTATGQVDQTAIPQTTVTPTLASGLPDTGGAPLRNEDSPWSLLLIIGSVIALTVGIVVYRRSSQRQQE